MINKTTQILFGMSMIMFLGLTTLSVYKYNKNSKPTTTTANLVNLKCEEPNMDPETDTLEFHKKMHKEIVRRVVQNWAGKKSGIIVVGGVKGDYQRQLRQFLYLSGVFLPVYGQYLIIELETGRTSLFAPKLTEYEAVWHLREIPSKDDIKSWYGQDRVFWNEEFETVLKNLNPSVIYMEPGFNLPSNPTNAPTDIKILDNYLHHQRAVKTDKEVRLLRVSNYVSSRAHLSVMRNIKDGLNEYHLQSLFKFACGNCGLKNQSYHPIIGGGRNAAILHYYHNNMELKGNSILLIDAGPEYYGYSSDITISIPVNGRYNHQQRIIYNIVLNTNVDAINKLKPGASWSKIVEEAFKKLLSELRDAGFVRGNIEEMYKKGIARLFQPHGLGHHTGLDVHDGTKVPLANLEQNMVLTIEPGCYFLSFLFEQATPAQKIHLNMPLIRSYYNFGGVRIEDDLLVTENGYEFLSRVPRTIKEIENFMNSE